MLVTYKLKSIKLRKHAVKQKLNSQACHTHFEVIKNINLMLSAYIIQKCKEHPT